MHPFLKISWKSVQPFFCNAAKRHGFLRKSGKKNSCVQGVKWKIPKMFPIVPCIKSHLPWKFHEDPFCRFSVMLLTDRQKNRWNITQRARTYQNFDEMLANCGTNDHSNTGKWLEAKTSGGGGGDIIGNINGNVRKYNLNDTKYDTLFLQEAQCSWDI